ncbi:SCO6745 family protein [Paractinoplanes maris]|uniref:SCO6745 family protein n=1 Tax=Paractinoplanes maris TaxID=1734446 RepID=UPI0020201D1B|nr:hypothetical protein [Actinoplanes maris]
MTEPSAERRMWALFEPLHAVTYFAPQCGPAFEEAGLTGFWRRYFAGRAAALGPIGPEPVTAAFFGFAPAMVARALPGVWSRITPSAAVAARTAGATAALTELFAGPPPAKAGPPLGEAGMSPDRAGLSSVQIAEAADLLGEAARAVDLPGRVLAAAHAGLPWPADPVARLWHAATILREHRGDGHVAALLTTGVDGAESLAWRASLEGGRLREVTQPARGWTDEEWEAAAARLCDRGWVAADGSATAAGREAYARVETLTDQLAAGPWARLGAAATQRCAELLAPLADRARQVIPDDNPIPLRRH